MLEARDNHGCGSFSVKDTQVIVVAGGFTTNTVEFLFQDDENASWITGKSSIEHCILVFLGF